MEGSPSSGRRYIASLKEEEACCSRVRVYRWNELAHNTDTGDDLFIFVIKNKFFINNFPPKSEIPHEFSYLGCLLLWYGFIPYGHRYEGGCPLVSHTTWKDMFKFNRKSVSNHDFGYTSLKALDNGVFLDETLVPLGKQISANLNSRFPSFDDYITNSNKKDETQNQRIVIMVEIYRTRTIEVDFDVILYDMMLRPVVNPYSVDPESLCNTLQIALPSNPHKKVPEVAYYSRTGWATEALYDPIHHDLVTEPDFFIDGFLPGEDDYDIWEIVGFMRAWLCWEDGNLEFLRSRNEGPNYAVCPYKLMSPEKAAGFAEIEPILACPSTETTEITCPICLDNSFCSFRNMVAETCCFHVFHAACLSPWISKTPSCPLCRSPQW